MARGKHLSQFEKRQISALRHERLSLRQIAEHVQRSVGAVQSSLSSRKKPHQPTIAKTFRKLSPQKHRALLREARKGNLTASDLKRNHNLSVSVRRVQQLLKEDETLKYSKMMQGPKMTEDHKVAQLQCVRRNISKGDFTWNKVILSDEKKFNLDGPDGLSYYWHDLRTEPRGLSSLVGGGNSVMVWDAISLYGVSDLLLISGTQDSKKYCDTLELGLLPWTAEIFGPTSTWVFQQDSASIYRSAFTNNWLLQHQVWLLSWPAKSPDLKIIENFWGLMARKVYANGKQFENFEDLNDSILNLWRSLTAEYIQKLYPSISRRLLAVMDKRGGAAKY